MKIKRESKITVDLTAKETADILIEAQAQRINIDGGLGKLIGATAEDKDGLAAEVVLNFQAES